MGMDNFREILVYFGHPMAPYFVSNAIKTSDPRIPEVKIVEDAGVANFTAVNGEIHYNKSFMAGLPQQIPNGRTDLFLYWFIFHELGHIVHKDQGYTAAIGKNHVQELRADQFAMGTIAQNSPESLKPVAETVFGTLKSLNFPTSDTHPSNDVRAGTVASAYGAIMENQAFGIMLYDSDYIANEFIAALIKDLDQQFGQLLGHRDSEKIVAKINTEKKALLYWHLTLDRAITVKQFLDGHTNQNQQKLHQAAQQHFASIQQQVSLPSHISLSPRIVTTADLKLL